MITTTWDREYLLLLNQRVLPKSARTPSVSNVFAAYSRLPDLFWFAAARERRRMISAAERPWRGTRTAFAILRNDSALPEGWEGLRDSGNHLARKPQPLGLGERGVDAAQTAPRK